MCFDEEPRDEHEECSREIHDLEKLAVRCEAHQGEVSERCVCCEAVEVKRLRAALQALKNGDCWCDRYYDPMCGHQDRCNQAREAAEAED